MTKQTVFWARIRNRKVGHLWVLSWQDYLNQHMRSMCGLYRTDDVLIRMLEPPPECKNCQRAKAE